MSSGRQQLLDLAGDGQLDLVALAGPTPGFYERTFDQDWAPFRTFRQLPNIAWDDPNLRFVDLHAVADRRTQGFSQGERMKVAIARALVHEPATILLDEPTNGLDIMSVRALREQLRDLRAAGCCLLFSSHVMQEVAALCDRIVILGEGRVVAQGSAEELIAQSGAGSLEDAFVSLLGTGEGLAA